MFGENMLRTWGWNQRVLTHADFEEICRFKRIEVIEAEMGECKGFSIIEESKSLIVLNRSLKGFWRDFIGWHELAHHLLCPAQIKPLFKGHSVERYYFSRNYFSLSEEDADWLAAGALFPETLLKEKSIKELKDEHNCPDGILAFRLRRLVERRLEEIASSDEQFCRLADYLLSLDLSLLLLKQFYDAAAGTFRINLQRQHYSYPSDLAIFNAVNDKQLLEFYALAKAYQASPIYSEKCA